jgi:hypothetical protein
MLSVLAEKGDVSTGPYGDNGRVAIPSIRALPSSDRSHSSTITVLMEKPIQNAIPKNSLGDRWVIRLVAKNIPITGRPWLRIGFWACIVIAVAVVL